MVLIPLLNDMADAKFYNGDETIGPKIAAEFLKKENVDFKTVTHVINIIKYISFKNSLSKTGQKIAIKGHPYMEQFLKQFYNEWHGFV